MRQKHQEVEHVVTQSGTNTAANTDGGAGVHRGSLGDGDWIQLNGPFNLFQIDSITFRVADATPAATAAAPRTVGSPLAAIEIRQDSITGPILTTANLTSTGSTTAGLAGTARRSRSAVDAASTSCSSCSARSTGGATGGNLFNLNWAEFNGNGVTVVKTEHPGHRRRQRCRRRCRCRSARRPRSARSRRA